MRPQAIFPCYPIIDVEHIEPFRHGFIFSFDFIGHVVEDHRKREIETQHAGRGNFSTFVICGGLGVQHIAIDVGRRLQPIRGVFLPDVYAEELDPVT